MHTPKRVANKEDQFSQFNQKCVCQVCTCGKHHCPPKTTKFFGETTNHHDYKPFNITAQRQQVCHHEFKQRHYDPDTLKTSYKKDFQAYKVQPHLNSDKCEYRQNKQPFYDQTQYKKSYPAYQVVIDRPATCTQIQFRNPAKFDGTTTYQAEFNPKKIQKVLHSPVSYERKRVPFLGETVYNSQFKPHQIQIRKPNACYCQAYEGRKNKFMGESRYHEQFKPYQIEKKCTCPINQMPEAPKQCSPGKNHLNFSAEKHKWE